MASPLVLAVEDLLGFAAFCRISEEDFLSDVDVYSFESPPQNIAVGGDFGKNCRIVVRKGVAFPQKHIIVSCFSWPDRTRDNITIVFLDCPGQTHFRLFGGDSHFIFSRKVQNFNSTISDWGGSGLHIGDEASCVGARIELSTSDITIGKKCLFSSDIVLQCHDGHGIVDLETMQIVNTGRGYMEIGDRVWLGRRATILKNVKIGDGSIVANSAVVTRDVGECCLAAGVPAKTIRRNISWSHNAAMISESELEFFQRFRDDEQTRYSAG